MSEYGIKIGWTQADQGQAALTLVTEEPGRAGAAFNTFVPILMVGSRAEDAAEPLEPGDLPAVAGTLAYKAAKTKDAAKMVVVPYEVECPRIVSTDVHGVMGKGASIPCTPHASRVCARPQSGTRH